MKPLSPVTTGQVPCQVQRQDGSGTSVVPTDDILAVEEPLEIRVRGTSFAVLMRTPGRDADLAAGFLAAEGLLQSRQDLTAMSQCTDPQTGLAEPNIWNVACAEGVSFDPRSLRLGLVASSCGLCGVRTLEDLQRAVPGLAHGLPHQLSSSALFEAFKQLRARQEIFALTAGSHGAALWDPFQLELLDVAEDVGRHNAVDKLLGARLLADDYPLRQAQVLLITGRISFELVQKAAMAGIPMVAGIGMPTSLAVEGAKEMGQVLVGWVRDASVNLYAGTMSFTP